MKILLINYTDIGGGAAIACSRIKDFLIKNGFTATLGVIEEKGYGKNVIKLPQKHRGVFTNKYVVKLVDKCFSPLHGIFMPKFKTTNGILHTLNLKSNTDIKWINDSDYDIVNLHWISGVVSVKDISKIKKPIVWTMHDSWPCCGAEHHPNVLENDFRYRDGYYYNNKPTSTKGLDLCRMVWGQKKKYLTKKGITFISPSNWERDILKESALFKDNTCYVIPNIIPTEDFKPGNNEYIKEIYGIPKDKIILGFGAAGDIDNPKSMKGSYFLVEALKKIQNPENYFLVVFGPCSSLFTSKITIPYFVSGYLSNNCMLGNLYSICDCFINPSLIENLPTTCLESIFCGTPVVAFDVGGTKDIVEHKRTGYLAKAYETDDLVNGIEYCVSNYAELSVNCLAKAKKDFNATDIIKKYIEVFQKVLNQES